MKKFSTLSFGALVVAGLFFAACDDSESVVSKMKPAASTSVKAAPEAKNPVQEPAPAPVAEVAPPQEEEPQLVSLQSLNKSNSTEAEKPADKEKKTEVADASENEALENSDIAPLSHGSYVIQISIQSSKKAADAVIKKLAAKNIRAYYVKVENPGELEGTFYRIRVGYFANSATAQQYGASVLSPLNYAWWVDMAKNDGVGNPAGNSSRSYDSYMDDGEDENDSYVAPAPKKQEAAPAPAAAPQVEPKPAEPTPAPAPEIKEEAAPVAPAPSAAPPAPAPEQSAPASANPEDIDDWE